MRTKINTYNNVLVMGDIMLDCYIYGEAHRISPEAPVLVIEVGGESERLGGASNVANNIVALGGNAAIIGVVGEDEAGSRVISFLDRAGVHTGALISADKCKTIVKTRIVCGQQQVARLDYYDNPNYPDDIYDEIYLRFLDLIGKYDIVIISDYAKGDCQKNLCKRIIKKS